MCTEAIRIYVGDLNECLRCIQADDTPCELLRVLSNCQNWAEVALRHVSGSRTESPLVGEVEDAVRSAAYCT